MSETHLELDRVSVRYGSVSALSEVSLRVPEGRIVALIGSNGAGKSSTLRAITGLASLAHGDILLSGRSIATVPAHERVRAGIALVPEGRHVLPYMSVRDNLLMGAYTRRDRDGIAADLERVVRFFPRLGERSRQQGSSLSGGEQQMVAIGRALMTKPRLLLLDEPSLGIAPQVVRLIARSLIEINRAQGTTILLVEQNSRMALKISHYAYVLQTGRIALQGTSAELMNDPEVRRLYLGG